MLQSGAVGKTGQLGKRMKLEDASLDRTQCMGLLHRRAASSAAPGALHDGQKLVDVDDVP